MPKESGFVVLGSKGMCHIDRDYCLQEKVFFFADM
jgi:hypothetical protein